ncbi:TetR/AcrR family transcriptional regulator [Kineosporia rhizophila]|uniref:TetR/AcrR family transcriptional regulator n=1 Tax=Kineosporia rhizophila TaxID=84633 RepID=UPI001E2F9FF6|nr:TetR/AcrR family transcriptional regulator [Kineosporia rhizophila]MCE0537565.1 TetR/AcrR family transcriptional regulator [Kineosporia rhizophila]
MSVTGRRLPARERLLWAAGEVFYQEGLRATGVDRVVEHAGVTRATFYRQFPSKELLLVAYVQALDTAVREYAGPVPEGADDAAAWLLRLTERIAAEVSAPGFRGCPFINAAAEFPSADHPVRVAVAAHRTWLEDEVALALERSGQENTREGARRWLAQRDGAMVGAYLGSAEAAAATLVAAVSDLVR